MSNIMTPKKIKINENDNRNLNDSNLNKNNSQNNNNDGNNNQNNDLNQYLNYDNHDHNVINNDIIYNENGKNIDGDNSNYDDEENNSNSENNNNKNINNNNNNNNNSTKNNNSNFQKRTYGNVRTSFSDVPIDLKNPSMESILKFFVGTREKKNNLNYSENNNDDGNFKNNSNNNNKNEGENNDENNYNNGNKIYHHNFDADKLIDKFSEESEKDHKNTTSSTTSFGTLHPQSRLSRSLNNSPKKIIRGSLGSISAQNSPKLKGNSRENSPKKSEGNTCVKGLKNENSIFNSKYTVFDSLYDARENSQLVQNEARRRFFEEEKAKNILSFHPDTGVNTCYPVEKNKNNFFARMHNTRLQHEHNKIILAKKIHDHEMGRDQGSGEEENEDLVLSQLEVDALSQRYVQLYVRYPTIGFFVIYSSINSLFSQFYQLFFKFLSL